MRESEVKKYLFRRVRELGGEIRKLKWEGRSKAPDTIVLLPPVKPMLPMGATVRQVVAIYGKQKIRTIWIELKTEGGAATFPKNAHEEGQLREHGRFREMGQRVEVLDSIESIDRALS